MSNAPANLNEYDSIAKVVQHYIDGAKSGRGTDMRPAFHQDATIFGYVGADLFAGPIQQLFDWSDQKMDLQPSSRHGWRASTSSARSPRCGSSSTIGPGTGSPMCLRC